MRVLLFVLHVSMMRECQGDNNAGVRDDGGIVASAGHEYVGGTRARDECSAWDERSWWSVCNVYVFGSMLCRR